MNVNKVFILFMALWFWNCSEKPTERWNVDVPEFNEEIVLKDVSKSYYDKNQSNEGLRNEFPEFFSNASDSLLNVRRADLFSKTLNDSVNRYFTASSIQDSLSDIFARLKHYYPKFQVPTVYLFAGELDYQYPVIYYPESKEMVIGADWFLGKNQKFYDEMQVPDYFKRQMNPQNFKPKVVESLADHMVRYDIRKRKLIEKMIYEGKLLTVQDALLPQFSDDLKIGYIPEQIEWARENEANIYMYFTEQNMFYSDDKTLEGRFLDEAPFSKFYSDFDAQSPGKIGAWMGWQICRAYLAKHDEVTLPQFLANEDYQKIFTESGYKPRK